MATPTSNGPTPSGPIVRRLIVGSQLRKLREAAGITRADAGFHIRNSESKISRIELGKVSFKDRDVRDLLKLYGLTEDDERITALAQLADEANQPGWWQKYDDVMAKWFQTYVGLEEAAALIRSYEVQFVPGLLQTADYARAIISAGMHDARNAEIERRVDARIARQAILDRPVAAPKVWAVADEAALRRPVGGRGVMRRQLQHLLEITERPDVGLQILPFGLGAYGADGGAFTIVRFDAGDLQDIVYLEQLVSALYIEKPEQVEPYREQMERLSVKALDPEKSTDALRKILDSF